MKEGLATICVEVDGGQSNKDRDRDPNSIALLKALLPSLLFFPVLHRFFLPFSIFFSLPPSRLVPAPRVPRCPSLTTKPVFTSMRHQAACPTRGSPQAQTPAVALLGASPQGSRPLTRSLCRHRSSHRVARERLKERERGEGEKEK